LRHLALDPADDDAGIWSPGIVVVMSGEPGMPAIGCAATGTEIASTNVKANSVDARAFKAKFPYARVDLRI
jgi:hypothetical protein